MYINTQRRKAMKVKVLLISCVLLTFIIIVSMFVDNDDKVVFESGKSNTIVRSNALTMMYETEADSGEYQVSTENTWPQDGYIFNETLSKCENGSVLTWDNETNKIIMRANTSDKCYIYFDVYRYVIINNVATSETMDSITINVDASEGDGSIVSYHYSIDGGNSYISSTESSYTFNNLTSGTMYNVKVYVTDSNNKTSGISTLSIETKSCVEYLAVGTKLNMTNFTCFPSTGGLSDCNITEVGDVQSGIPSWSYYLDFTVSDINSILNSYYVDTDAPITNYEYIDMGKSYLLYDNTYFLSTSAGGVYTYRYSYHFSMQNDYCDLCINGTTYTVADCNDPDWYKYR